INPADAARPCSPRFRYLKTGDIKPAHADTAAREDIDVLNLNHPRAAAGRRAIIDAAILRVASQKGAVSSGVLERMAAQLETPDRLGNLMPYCQAAIYWLRRQARKR
ncbi:MAG: hypothetical protein JKY37_12260, partial [Nannocystaceae bacterium]|nr:hypothetical protein [Nannocystaceae bacterium]